MPTVVIQVEGAAVSAITLSLDGASVATDLIGEPRPIDPGSHQVIGVRGTERVEVRIDVAEGERKTAVVHFTEASVAAPPARAPQQGEATAPAEPETTAAPETVSSGSGRHTLAWVTIGVGAAGLVLGGVTGAMAVADRSALRSSGVCFGTDCGTREASKVDSYNSMRTLSSVGFIAGGVVAATGVVLLLTAPHGSHEANAALFVAPTCIGIKGAF